MILSILDTDLYKFSTSWSYMKLYPEAEGTFSFCDRNKLKFGEEFIELLKAEFAKLCTLSLTLGEKQWCCEHIKYIPEVYWEWLEWRKCIKISDDLGKHLGDDKEFEIAKYQLGI